MMSKLWILSWNAVKMQKIPNVMTDFWYLTVYFPVWLWSCTLERDFIITLRLCHLSSQIRNHKFWKIWSQTWAIKILTMAVLSAFSDIWGRRNLCRRAFWGGNDFLVDVRSPLERNFVAWSCRVLNLMLVNC